MPPPGKPMPPRGRPPPRLPGLPIRLPEATVTSLAHGDFVIIFSTSSEFQSLGGLVSQKSLEPKPHTGMAADATGRAAANRIKLRLVSITVRRTPGALRLRQRVTEQVLPQTPASSEAVPALLSSAAVTLRIQLAELDGTVFEGTGDRVCARPLHRSPWLRSG